MSSAEIHLKAILSTETSRLRKSYPSKDVIFPLIEIIRSLDYNHFILSHHTDSESAFLLEKYKFGWSRAFAEFYKDLNLSDNIPLFLFNRPEREWVDSIVQHAGSIGLCGQLLDYCKANLMTVKKGINTFTFRPLYEDIGTEYFERLSLAFYHSVTGKILEHKSTPLMQQLPEMRKKLKEIISVINNNFIQYKATPEIDLFYSTFGYLYLMTTQVIDDFGEDDFFGGIKYRRYIDFAQDLFKAIIMHRDCCMAAEIKTSYQVFLKDILTYAFSKNSFINNYSRYTGWSKEEIDQILSCFTLGKENIDYHLCHPSVSAPPYITLGQDTMMRSAYGSIDRPVFFLNRELKRRFPKDYFNAVNNREKRFRDQLYSMFPNDRIIKVNGNINIKSGKLVTDIDAALYDKERKSLGLFQLKWQDTFSASMKERYSRITNLIPKSVEWIDKIIHWISTGDVNTIARTLKLESKIDNIENIYLFVLSRNHVHFTNEKLDDRAIWASWYQMFEASAKIKDPTNSDPIGELAAILKVSNPEKRKLLERLPEIRDMHFKFSKYKVSVVSSKI